MYMLFFFFNDTATTEIYTLSLHDALPIYIVIHAILFHPQTLVLLSRFFWNIVRAFLLNVEYLPLFLDRKSTRLNSSHANISYAVFCLKKKKNLSFPPQFYHLSLTHDSPFT